MSEKLLIDSHYNDETRIAILNEKKELENFEVEYYDKKPIKGNIYVAKIVRIETSIQAAFIDYGDEKHGFLPISEIHYDYFNKDLDKSNEENIENADDIEIQKNKKIKIQDVLSLGQTILVQAEKEIRGNKCAFFTTFISLPGRYCVLMPNPPKGKSGGISKRIEFSEKNRLREILDSLNIPDGMGCIVRTAGESKTKQEIKRDLEYLLRLWSEIKEKTNSSKSPVIVYEEGNIIKRTIRDLYSKDIEKIIVQGQNAYKEARTFMKLFTPSHVKRIELYKSESVPIFQKYEIEEKIGKILDTVVLLPSGGSIVINTTEALTAIDVNSGKTKNEKDIEGTALRTNLEASIEIARQIKLRDIAGIIVIDFIDMEDYTSINKVEKKIKDAMKKDYSNVQISKISNFGLMQISRQRLRKSLADSTFVQCRHCLGTGKVLSNETASLSIIRKIEHFLINGNAKSIIVEVANGIDLFILNNKRKLISEMEKTYDVFIEILRNSYLNQMDCKIFVKEAKLVEDNNNNNIEKQNSKNDEQEATKIPPLKSQKTQNKQKKKTLDTPIEKPLDNNNDDNEKIINKTNIKPQKQLKNIKSKRNLEQENVNLNENINNQKQDKKFKQNRNNKKTKENHITKNPKDSINKTSHNNKNKTNIVNKNQESVNNNNIKSEENAVTPEDSINKTNTPPKKNKKNFWLKKIFN